MSETSVRFRFAREAFEKSLSLFRHKGCSEASMKVPRAPEWHPSRQIGLAARGCECHLSNCEKTLAVGRQRTAAAAYLPCSARPDTSRLVLGKSPWRSARSRDGVPCNAGSHGNLYEVAVGDACAAHGIRLKLRPEGGIGTYFSRWRFRVAGIGCRVVRRAARAAGSRNRRSEACCRASASGRLQCQ